jgi:hypothetical protein
MKEQVRSLQVEVWLGKDGKVEAVNESAHLGTQDMPKLNDLEPQVFECIGVYGRPDSKVRATFMLESLGTVGTSPKLGESSHEVKTDIKFNALSWLDEPEKVAALSDVEKVELQNIGVIELNDKVIAAILTHTPTAMSDAAMAIMQHALDTQEAFPTPTVTQEPNIVNVADHADGAKATLAVGTHMFTVGDKYWRFCSYGICNGKERYAFTWMNVPLAFLDEK